jgi:transposase
MASDLSRAEAPGMMARYQQKESISAISAATGRDRQPMAKVVAGQTDENTLARRSRPSKLDPYTESIAQRWAQGCHNAQVLWEAWQSQGFTGSLSLVKPQVAPLRPQRGVEPTRRFETAPGEQAPWDWADFGALVTPDGRRKLYIFAYTMSYSRRMYIEFVHDQRQEPLFACLEHAFAYFGCVPGTILSDHRPPMVVSHPFDGEIVWTPRFAAFAEFHGFRPKAARPYRARTKGQGERIVQYVRQNFWPRVPEAITLGGLNALVLRWAADRDHRIHGTPCARPADRWAVDSAGAAPYDPTRLWAFGEQWDRKVTPEAFVHWEGHRFAVPWEAAGHIVQVRRTAPDGIAMRQDQRVWARYPRPTEPHQVVGADVWHASPPPERVPQQPVARRRPWTVPGETVPDTRDLSDDEQVVPV